MSSNSNSQLDKCSSHLVSLTTPSNVTLASTLSFALAEIDRLKFEAKKMTDRANHAENLLLSLIVKDPSGSVSNTNNNSPHTASSSPAALDALAALISAESRAITAESRLATVLSSLSKLLHLDGLETDARRQSENIIVDERRKIVNSIENETKKTRFFDHTSQHSSSLPLLRTESAPALLASPSILPPPCCSVSHQSSYSQNGIPSGCGVIESTGPAVISSTRVRPRTTSDTTGLSQPPAKKHRMDRPNSSQMQPPTSFYRYPTHPNTATHATVYSYPSPTASQIAPHLHQTQNTYPQPPVTAPCTQNTSPRHKVQNSYPPRISYFNRPRIPSNSSANPNSISVPCLPHTAYHHHHQQQQYPQKPTNIASANDNVNRHLTTTLDRGSSSHHARESGIPDYHRQQGRHHPGEQSYSVKSLDDRSHLNSNQLPQTEALLQDEATGLPREDGFNGVSINDLLSEFSRRGSGRKSEVGIKERRDSGGENSAVGKEEKSTADIVIKSDEDVVSPVETQVHVQSQPEPQVQFQTVTVVVLDNNDRYASPSISPQPSSISSISGESPRPAMSTASNSLSGLRPLGSIPTQDLFKAAGFPSGKYPDTNTQGEKTCRQCGQPGSYENGKCVEKWSAGPEGPKTLCDR